MKYLLPALGLSAILLAIFTLPTSFQANAQSSNPSLSDALALPICAGVGLTSPANPAFVTPDAATQFAWSGEPDGTSRRAVYIFDANGSGRLTILDAAAGGTVAQLTASRDFPGTYNWLVVFFNAEGNPTCRSEGGWLDVHSGNNNPASGSSDSGGGGSVNVVVVQTSCGFIIVKLQNSPYTGTFDIEELSDNYDASNFDLGGCQGMIIHGNDNGNVISGSAGDDTIYGYGGTDQLVGDSFGGAVNSGNDTLYGGADNDSLFGDSGTGASNTGNDTLYGEDGIDFLYGDSLTGGVNSGNDTLDGGDGEDYLYGDSLVGGSNTGNDTLSGRSGSDFLYGDALIGGGTGTDSCDGGVGGGNSAAGCETVTNVP